MLAITVPLVAHAADGHVVGFLVAAGVGDRVHQRAADGAAQAHVGGGEIGNYLAEDHREIDRTNLLVGSAWPAAWLIVTLGGVLSMLNAGEV